MLSALAAGRVSGGVHGRLRCPARCSEGVGWPGVARVVKRARQGFVGTMGRVARACDIHAELQRLGSHHPLHVAAAHVRFDAAALGRAVARAVGRHALGEVGVPRAAQQALRAEREALAGSARAREEQTSAWARKSAWRLGSQKQCGVCNYCALPRGTVPLPPARIPLRLYTSPTPVSTCRIKGRSKSAGRAPGI